MLSMTQTWQRKLTSAETTESGTVVSGPWGVVSTHVVLETLTVRLYILTGVGWEGGTCQSYTLPFFKIGIHACRSVFNIDITRINADLKFGCKHEYLYFK